MIIEDNKVISLTYRLSVNQTNEEVEVVNADRPLTFIFGRGSLLGSFETQVKGLSVGQNFDFVLNSEEAYGVNDENAVMELPISLFSQDGSVDNDLLSLGNVIPMKDQSGRRFNGKVIGLTNSHVKMDFNHPMAGKDLHFVGEVIDVRDATEEELKYGLNAGGCSGCSGSCDDGSCGPEDCNDNSCGCS
jgi:FKBP-type peptidyl-prolyl cis-trans isomerase SlyD